MFATPRCYRRSESLQSSGVLPCGGWITVSSGEVRSHGSIDWEPSPGNWHWHSCRTRLRSSVRAVEPVYCRGRGGRRSAPGPAALAQWSAVKGTDEIDIPSVTGWLPTPETATGAFGSRVSWRGLPGPGRRPRGEAGRRVAELAGNRGVCTQIPAGPAVSPPGDAARCRPRDPDRPRGRDQVGT